MPISSGTYTVGGVQADYPGTTGLDNAIVDIATSLTGNLTFEIKDDVTLTKNLCVNFAGHTLTIKNYTGEYHGGKYSSGITVNMAGNIILSTNDKVLESKLVLQGLIFKNNGSYLSLEGVNPGSGLYNTSILDVSYCMFDTCALRLRNQEGDGHYQRIYGCKFYNSPVLIMSIYILPFRGYRDIFENNTIYSNSPGGYALYLAEDNALAINTWTLRNNVICTTGINCISVTSPGMDMPSAYNNRTSDNTVELLTWKSGSSGNVGGVDTSIEFQSVNITNDTCLFLKEGGILGYSGAIPSYITQDIAGVSIPNKIGQYPIGCHALEAFMTEIYYISPVNVENPEISILEKVNRITELQDVNLVELDQLQHLASNLGYNIDINRAELGNLATTDVGASSATDVEKYMRFVVSNLPNWYKIKSTRNAVKTMLYSFGLIGDVSFYFTSNYLPENEGGKWIVQDYEMKSNSLDKIPSEFYTTPHFIVWIDLNQNNLTNLSWEYSKRKQIINAIESIRPVNTVFRHLGAYQRFYMNLYVNCHSRIARHIKIPCDGFADYWA